MTGSYTKAEASAKKHEKSLAELTAELTPDALDIPLEKNVSNVMLDVLNSRLRHGITLDSSSPNKQGVGGFNKVQDLSEKVPNSSLYSLRVNLRGSYKTYAGLMNYLKELQVHPAAIVRLKVQEKSFEASIRIYGTK